MLILSWFGIGLLCALFYLWFCCSKLEKKIEFFDFVVAFVFFLLGWITILFYILFLIFVKQIQGD
jgi:hypothetical protein